MARFVAFILCIATLAACSSEPEDQRPSPTVSAGEVENRLQEHLTRLVTAVFDTDVTVSEPAVTRTPGCGNAGPDWAVTPRAELKVSAGDRDRTDKYFDDVQIWRSSNGFGKEVGHSGSWASPVEEYDLEGPDGVLMTTEVHRDTNQFNLVLTGPCAWPPDRPDGPASGQLKPLPAPSGKAKADVDADNQVCKSPRLYVFDPAAPPYAGPGPHPLKVLNYGPRNVSFTHEKVAEPAGWLTGAVQSPVNAAPQVVVCVGVEITTDTGRDVTCQYRDPSDVFNKDGSPSTFDVFNSVYHVTMREAKTGNKLDEFTIPGNRKDDENCPYQLMNYQRPLAMGIDKTELTKRLRQFYD